MRTRRWVFVVLVLVPLVFPALTGAGRTRIAAPTSDTNSAAVTSSTFFSPFPLVCSGPKDGDGPPDPTL